MTRWRKALIAGSLGMVAVAAFAVQQPASAETVNLVVDYSCTGGIAGPRPVTLRARVNIPTVVRKGGFLELGWSIEPTGASRFISPGYFAAGAKVALEGNVRLEGAWNGTLRPRGSKDQPALQPNVPLSAPEGISSSANLTEEGVIKLTPEGLNVDFVPPAGEVVINDDDARVNYATGTWAHVGPTNVEYGDHLRDVHTANARSDAARLTFYGTGFEYIGRRMPGVSKVRVIIDDDPSAVVDPKLNLDGSPTNAINGNVSLWKRDDLSYGRHTVTIRNTEDNPIHLDAFKVLTRDMIDPPTEHKATCVITNNPGTVEINVQGATSPSPSVTPTRTPTTTPTATPTNTTTTPAANTTPPHVNVTPGDDPRHVSVIIKGTPNTTVPSPSTSASATATRYVKAQVAKTPKGGVDTGEAPEEAGREPYALMAGGSMLLLGSAAGGGMLLRRRRAEHTRGADA